MALYSLRRTMGRGPKRSVGPRLRMFMRIGSRLSLRAESKTNGRQY